MWVGGGVVREKISPRGSKFNAKQKDQKVVMRKKSENQITELPNLLGELIGTQSSSRKLTSAWYFKIICDFGWYDNMFYYQSPNCNFQITERFRPTMKLGLYSLTDTKDFGELTVSFVGSWTPSHDRHFSVTTYLCQSLAYEYRCLATWPHSQNW